MLERLKKLVWHPAATLTIQPSCGIYVDVENLPSAKSIIRELVSSWPSLIPRPSQLSLYVRADQTALWRAWAESQFPDLAVRPKGIQHLSGTKGKNAADIELVMDAVADFLLGRITYVAVVSDDSDFISLYSKIRDEQESFGYTPGNVPFLWVLTDRAKNQSATIGEYFPGSHIHVVRLATPKGKTTEKPQADIAQTTAIPLGENGSPVALELALAITAEIPTGNFKSIRCKPIIQRLASDHPLATAEGAGFGSRFSTEIWPVLKQLGVKKHNNKGGRLRYEITEAAKENAQKHLEESTANPPP